MSELEMLRKRQDDLVETRSPQRLDRVRNRHHTELLNYDPDQLQEFADDSAIWGEERE